MVSLLINIRSNAIWLPCQNTSLLEAYHSIIRHVSFFEIHVFDHSGMSIHESPKVIAININITPAAHLLLCFIKFSQDIE